VTARAARRIALPFVLACVAAGLPATVAAEVQPPAGFTALFNGEDLAGWYAANFHQAKMSPTQFAEEPEEKRTKQLQQWWAEAVKHWSVENGELVNDGHGAYLTTDREYGDIELLLEYKTVAKADSGIYLRGTPQVQIWDTTEEGGKWDRNADKGSGGLFNNEKDAPGQLPLVHADKPFGQWNRFRIVQVGERTSVWLNGRLVVDHALMDNYWQRDKPLPRTGPIQLQTHGGEIRWRNVFIREIPAHEANYILASHNDDGYESVFNGKDFSGWEGPTDEYAIENGAMYTQPGKGGTIYTTEEYGNFKARLEFRLPPGGNNGLAIRYPGEGNPAYHGMTELQVLDTHHPRYGGGLDPRQAHGSAYGMAAAETGYLRPTGEWNFQEVTVDGSRIVVELNGTVILDTDLSEITEYMADSEHPGKELASGHFGFAGHSDPVRFRNIRIARLADETAEEAPAPDAASTE
jgi:hypothetical protein